MGRSPRANIFYGYAFTPENTWPWEVGKEDDYEKWESFRERDWELSHFYVHLVLGKTEEEVDAMGWEERSELAKSCQVELGHWGYSEEPCYYLRPKDKKADLMFSWDSAEILDTGKLKVNPEWATVLKEFCEKAGVDTKGKDPTWHIVVSDD